MLTVLARKLVGCTILTVLALAAPSLAWSSDACTAATGPLVWAATARLTPDPAHQPAVVYAYSRMPVGGPVQIGVADTPFPGRTDSSSFTKLRVLVWDADDAADQAEAAAANAETKAKVSALAAKEAADEAATADTTANAGGADAVAKAKKADSIASTANNSAVADRKDADAAAKIAADATQAVSASFIDGLSVTPSAAAADNPLVKATRIRSGDLLLDFIVPSPWLGPALWWYPAKITVIACGNDDRVIFTSTMNTTLSNWWCCGAIALFVTIILYVLAALGACTVDNKSRKKEKKKSVWEYLDPVQLSSGPNGQGSISRLQILFFTVLLFFILLFLLFRIGLLSDMSQTVLLLLGISAVGAAASKATDMQNNRLTSENWSWLVSRKWLPEHGLMSEATARWRDLVTADDGFDVYHFQMLIFSLVVGVALLQTGFTDLAHFEVPNALLAVLGLSQTVYVGGKLVSAPSCGDLDKMVTELRTREVALAVLKRAAEAREQSGADTTAQKAATHAAASAAAIAGGTADVAAAAAAKVVADAAAKKAADAAALTTAQDAFATQMQTFEAFFPSVLGKIPADADRKAHTGA